MGEVAELIGCLQVRDDGTDVLIAQWDEAKVVGAAVVDAIAVDDQRGVDVVLEEWSRDARGGDQVGAVPAGRSLEDRVRRLLCEAADRLVRIGPSSALLPVSPATLRRFVVTGMVGPVLVSPLINIAVTWA